MKKISLNLNDLTVESFNTDRGTVVAHGSCVTYSCKGTCGAYPDSTIEKMGGATFTNCNACCV